MYYCLEDVKAVMERCAEVFPSVAYAHVFVPVFCAGQGLLLASRKQVRYYSPLNVF